MSTKSKAMNIKTLVKKLNNRLVSELPNLVGHSVTISIEYSSLKINTEVKLYASAYPKSPEGDVIFDNKHRDKFWFFIDTKKGLADALKAFDEKLLGINSISKLNIEDNE